MTRQALATFTEFFSNNPSCEQIVQALYDLNQLEFEIYCVLLHFEQNSLPSNVDTLMVKVKRDDRTMINRALLTLLELDLCQRTKISEKGKRGYRYNYGPTPLTELKARLLENINTWYDFVIDEINHIEDRFKEKDKLLREM